MKSSSETAPDRGTYTLDSDAKPKGMTITGTEGPNRGKTFPAIYELNGDTLRICYDLSGAKRPTEFKTSAGTKLYLVTYNRQLAWTVPANIRQVALDGQANGMVFQPMNPAAAAKIEEQNAPWLVLAVVMGVAILLVSLLKSSARH